MKSIHVVAAVIRSGSKIFATQRGYGNYKDWWEFPGGKIEPGETGEEALRREIREELDTVIDVGDLIETVEYDYPEFHLTMDCYWAEVREGHLELKEHEAARWLGPEEFDTVRWLPADDGIMARVRTVLSEDGKDTPGKNDTCDGNGK